MKNYTRLYLSQFKLFLSLGVTEVERSRKQMLLVDIDIDFPEPPKGCFTDQLDDTYCYDVLTQKMTAELSDKTFYLIEHLAHEIYQLVKRFFSPSFIVQVSVTKEPFLSTGLAVASARFSYGDK